MLRVYTELLEIIRALRPVFEEIGRHDSDLSSGQSRVAECRAEHRRGLAQSRQESQCSLRCLAGRGSVTVHAVALAPHGIRTLTAKVDLVAGPYPPARAHRTRLEAVLDG
ncbi:MAG: hypothetical protein ACXWVM_30910 [Polyangiales bacterium]